MNDFAQCLVKPSPNMYSDDTRVTCSAEDIDTLYDDLRTELKYFRVDETKQT